MFSALRRLAKPGEGKDSSMPAPMSSALQKRFSRGVNYNMKILIKGDRNVGKSCLLQRLQGGPFVEEYQPTEQIQAAPIHWSYKNSDHIVKVEVWEVVDKGKAKKKSTLGLKFENQPSGPTGVEAFETPALDATFLDVYKNANGVILMMDITKPWTFDYVQREFGSIPSDLPVIILGNHCDMHHHRQVHKHQIEQFISMVKQTRNGSIRYAESSMRNGFGLRLLHKFLNVPFLKLQRTTLLEQLRRNEHDIISANEELDLFQNSEESDYTIFIDRLVSKRSNGQSTTAPANPIHDKTPSIVLGGGKPIVPSNINPLIGSTQTEPSAIIVKDVSPESPVTAAPLSRDAENRSFTSRLSDDQSIKTTPKSKAKSGPINNVDDFCPGALDHSFLDDFSSASSGHNTQRADEVLRLPQSRNVDSDSDCDSPSNPMVLVVQDDIESDEENSKSFKPINAPQPKMIITLSSGDVTMRTPLFDHKLHDRQSNTPIEMEPSDQKSWMPSVERSGDSFWKFERNYGHDETVGLQIDTSFRRSPEGGEDPDAETAEVKSTKMREEKKHHKKSKKSKDKEKMRDRDEKSDSGDRKDKKQKEKRHRKKKF